MELWGDSIGRSSRASERAGSRHHQERLGKPGSWSGPFSRKEAGGGTPVGGL